MECRGGLGGMGMGHDASGEMGSGMGVGDVACVGRRRELRPNRRHVWTSERWCLHSHRRLVAGTLGSLFHKV
jgi:hypothetical protein